MTGPLVIDLLPAGVEARVVAAEVLQKVGRHLDLVGRLAG